VSVIIPAKFSRHRLGVYTWVAFGTVCLRARLRACVRAVMDRYSDTWRIDVSCDAGLRAVHAQQVSSSAGWLGLHANASMNERSKHRHVNGVTCVCWCVCLCVCLSVRKWLIPEDQHIQSHRLQFRHVCSQESPAMTIENFRKRAWPASCDPLHFWPLNANMLTAPIRLMVRTSNLMCMLSWAVRT